MSANLIFVKLHILLVVLMIAVGMAWAIEPMIGSAITGTAVAMNFVERLISYKINEWADNLNLEDGTERLIIW